MIISNQQLMLLFQVLVDSLPIDGQHSPFRLTRDARSQLADDILNQQARKLKEVE
jgi:hypothetical protein